jgi:hypothetical protein
MLVFRNLPHVCVIPRIMLHITQMYLKGKSPVEEKHPETKPVTKNHRLGTSCHKG